MLDITLPEAVIHLEALREELKETGPWAVLAGNYTFGKTTAEVRALRRIAELGRSLQAPFLAEAAPDTPTYEWAEFRSSPEAVWIGLALPRFLLRLPYGESTSPIESFDFEEMPKSVHTAYLWGNPVFLCVALLARAFDASGWEMESIPRQVDGLPLHIYYDDGEAVAKPCAEVLLSHSEAEYLLDEGLMPLVSVKGQDRAVLMRFQSVAEPLQGLPGF
jgi:predicted component of type VI protein secretion system